jgi:hypothetical protein
VQICIVKVHEQNNDQNNYSLHTENPPKKISKMKKLILAALLVAFSIFAFAGGSDADKKLLSDLQAAMKASTSVKWSTVDEYSKGTFSFNGKTVSACLDAETSAFIGFSIHLTGADFPQDAVNAVQKKYPDWKITDAIYFVDDSANGNYFAQVEKGNNKLALKITASGKVSIFSRMP